MKYVASCDHVNTCTCVHTLRHSLLRLCSLAWSIVDATAINYNSVFVAHFVVVDEDSSIFDGE